MASALGIALALWVAPPQPSASEPEPLCDLAVRTGPLDYAEFAAAAALRLPAVRLREANGDADPACAGHRHGYVELRAIADGSWELSLISSDGRAWFRTVVSDPDQAARALASALANLIAAIEDASTDPDAVEVTVPPELVESEPIEEPIEKPSPSEPRQPEPEPRLLLELGPRLAGAVIVGLAPGPGLRASGGGFGFDLRLPDGLGFGLDVRVSSKAAEEVRLVRTRVALGVGYVVERGSFELPILFSGVIEPWQVRTAGDRAPLGQPPMIGGGARIAPGLVWPAGSVLVRLGVPIGFEIAVDAARGGLAPAIARDPTSEPLLRAGGVELSFGLELGVWIPVHARGVTARRSR